jgi:hypothetical protein
MGHRDDGSEVRVSPYGANLLIVGTSGSGKSTLATGLLERLAERKYQFCIIDPEGDYEGFEEAVPLGTGQRSPGLDEVLQLLKAPTTNVAINLIGLPIVDRPSFFLSLLPRLQELRARTGRPHWLVVDETHHLLPAEWQPAAPALSQAFEGMVRISVHPGMIMPAALAAVETVVAVGNAPAEMLAEFCAAVGEPPPEVPGVKLEPGEVLVWRRGRDEAPFRMKVAPGRTDRRRHSRKYAEGELPPDRSFYFRGPDGKLKLRAQNLVLFLQMAEGVDDETWTYHLRQGDYSDWFRRVIKDDELAAEAEQVEALAGATPEETRAKIKAAVEQRYTAPASPPLPMPGTDAAGRPA